MYTEKKALFLLNETPLHAGSGDSLGIVDNPIQRERHTGFPKIEASSFKGAMREAFEQHAHGQQNPILDAKIRLAFGPEDAGNEAFQGSIAFTDARLLLFPVRSMKGVFAWICCPRILRQLERDMNLIGNKISLQIPPKLSETPGTACIAMQDSKLTFVERQQNKHFAILEEYTFYPLEGEQVLVHKGEGQDRSSTELGEWLHSMGILRGDELWEEKIQRDILVLHDDDFNSFVNLSTEVITRIRIDNETGTVAEGALFTEEYLPTESLLYTLVMSSNVFQSKQNIQAMLGNQTLESAREVMDFFDSHRPDLMQAGGNASLGKGIIRSYSLTL